MGGPGGCPVHGLVQGLAWELLPLPGRCLAPIGRGVEQSDLFCGPSIWAACLAESPSPPRAADYLPDILFRGIHDYQHGYPSFLEQIGGCEQPKPSRAPAPCCGPSPIS